MNRGNRSLLREARDTAHCFRLGPSDEGQREANSRPSAPPDSGEAWASRATGAHDVARAPGQPSASKRPSGPPVDPLEGESFRALRELRREFASGGLPPQSERTPADEARIATFCVLQELMHVLGQYRRVVARGNRARLVVSEHGRQLGRVVIEVRIETELT